MIFDGKFANFHVYSLNFCQQVDFLPEGGGPRIFVKYSPVKPRYVDGQLVTPNTKLTPFFLKPSLSFSYFRTSESGGCQHLSTGEYFTKIRGPPPSGKKSTCWQKLSENT